MKDPEDVETIFTDYTGKTFQLPDLPRTKLEWLAVTRKVIDGNKYSLVPYQFWIAIYKEQAKRLFLLMARQLFKTTFFANSLAHLCTAFTNKSCSYVAPNEDKLTTFADEKFRDQTLQQSPILRAICRGATTGLPGRRGKVAFKTNSYEYNVTDEHGYGKVEGKSQDLVILDEIQEHDLEALGKLQESMSKKLGDIMFGGVGGEGGSIEEDLWLSTTQNEWRSIYDDSMFHGFAGQGWRKDLQFGTWFDDQGLPRKGLKYGDYMRDVCSGEWTQQEPSNYMFPGYHISQEMACHVPLTERDAIDLYKIPPEFSIEWKRKNYPRVLYIAHVLGGFYKAPRRPISRQDVMKLMEPYRYMPMWTSQDVLEMKTIFPERIQIFMGCDWGSGIAGASQTVISIMLKWRGMYQGRYSPDRDRYFLIFQERLDVGISHTMQEAFHVMELFKKYWCDYGAADLGYGEIQVNTIIDGGIHPGTRQFVPGLTTGKFIGTWTRTKVEYTEKRKPYKYDEEGSEEISHVLLDKTHIIDNFVNMVKWRVPNPNYPDDPKDQFSRMKLAIPYLEEWKVDQMVRDFTSITRKDIDQDITSVEPDARQKAQKQYNHPPDSVVSIIHCQVADQQFNQSGGFGGVWTGEHRKGPGPTAGPGALFRGTRR